MKQQRSSSSLAVLTCNKSDITLQQELYNRLHNNCCGLEHKTKMEKSIKQVISISKKFLFYLLRAEFRLTDKHNILY